MPANTFTRRLARGCGCALMMLTLMRLLPSRALAGSLVVTTTADEQVTNGLCSLREAIINSNNADQSGSTDCAAGSGPDLITFSVTGTILLASSLPAIGGDLTITGPGPAANALTISGNNAVRVLNVSAGGRLTLNNLTVSNGLAANDYGGGVRNSGVLVVNNSRVVNSRTTGNGTNSGGGGISNEGTLTVTHSVLSGNASVLGGGINSNGPTSIVNSQIWGNIAGEAGGGVVIFNGGKASITGGAIFSNTTTFTTPGGGAGIYNVDTLTLDHVSVSGNRTAAGANSDGGGILNTASGTLTLTSVIVDGNSAGGGGGVGNLGTATLISSTLSGNSAVQGGSGTGGGLYNSGTATLINSTLSGNSAEAGGGIDNTGRATLNNSTLSGNAASVDGGGLRSLGTATLNNSTLSGNTASVDGGGIFVEGGTLGLHNSTLSGNSATQQGGGIYNSNFGAGILLNATLSNNSAPAGGALFLQAGATTFVTNTIIAYSPAGGNCSGGITSSIYSISTDNTCAMLIIDPLLTALGSYGGPTQVHMLKSGSPAIDAVPGTAAPATDQRGFPRPPDGSYDIGAVERQLLDSNLAPRLYLPLIKR